MMTNNFPPTLTSLYHKQVEFQKMLGNLDIPKDDPNEMAHHLLGLVTEVGEVSQADKRWKKNKRNKHHDFQEKLDEIADCFIFLLNVCIYSDITPWQILEAINHKIEENKRRFESSEKDEEQK